MDKHRASPLGKLRLIREECFSLPIMLEHDHRIAGADDFAAVEADRPWIAHLAVSPTQQSAGYSANSRVSVGEARAAPGAPTQA
jgi:hypothetical protein